MLSANRVMSFKVCGKLESFVFFQIKINIQQIIDVYKWYGLTFYDDKMNKLVFGVYLWKRKPIYHWSKSQLCGFLFNNKQKTKHYFVQSFIFVIFFLRLHFLGSLNAVHFISCNFFFIFSSKRILFGSTA